MLLSMGFPSFIAGRPFPVLCQLFPQEPCSASLPAFAMGHVPLPVAWGVKQSSCEKARAGTAGRESWEQRQAAVPIPLLWSAALFLAGCSWGCLQSWKTRGLVWWSSLSLPFAAHPTLASAFLSPLSTRNTGTSMALLLLRAHV